MFCSFCVTSLDKDSKICEECPTDLFKEIEGNDISLCKACAPGLHVRDDVKFARSAEACIPCPANAFGSQFKGVDMESKWLACSACASGTFSDAGTVAEEDCQVCVVEPVHISSGLQAYGMVLGILGIIISAVLLLINVVKRKEPVIRVSSPKMAILSLSGGIGLCIWIILTTVVEIGSDCSIAAEDVCGIIRTTSAEYFGCTEFRMDIDRLCQAQVWVFAVSFSIFFGSIVAKVYRVHVIMSGAQSYKVIKKSDTLLMKGVALLVFLDCLVCAMWQIASPPELVINLEQRNEKTKTIWDQTETCGSETGGPFFGLLILLKAILIGTAFYYAYKIKGVQIHGMNESKELGFAVYNVSVLAVFLLPTVMIIEDKALRFVLLTIGTFIGVILTEALVFGTKVHMMIKKVDIFATHRGQTGTGGTDNTGTNGTDSATGGVRDDTELLAAKKVRRGCVCRRNRTNFFSPYFSLTPLLLLPPSSPLSLSM